MSAPNPQRREAEAFYSTLSSTHLRALHAEFTQDKANAQHLSDLDSVKFCESRIRIIEALLLTRFD